MSKIRHTLQLLYSGNPSQPQIGAALGISKSTVNEIASYRISSKRKLFVPRSKLVIRKSLSVRPMRFISCITRALPFSCAQRTILSRSWLSD